MNKDYLIHESTALKGCSDGQMQLKNAITANELVKTFYDRIDFCLANNFPSNEFLVANSELIKECGIVVDQKQLLSNPDKLVLLGSCDVEVIFTEYIVSRIYVKHSSLITIKASGNAFVMVDALDQSRVIAECTENARVVVNLYSNATSIGATKTIHKNRETYEL